MLDFITSFSPLHQTRYAKCASIPLKPALTYLEHQKSSLRTVYSTHALLSCACGAISSRETSSYRRGTTRRTSCLAVKSEMALDTTYLVAQSWRLGGRRFCLCLVWIHFYSSSFFAFAKGRLSHPCNSRPSHILFFCRLVERCLVQPSDLALDLARAESLPATQSQV